MISKNNIVKDLELILETGSNKKFYQDILEILLDIYIEMYSDVTIEDYYIDQKQHYISFGLKKEELSFELNVNNQYLEFRFFLIEIMFFENDIYFFNVRTEVLKSFFKGLYKVVHYYGQNDKIEIKELYWKNNILQRYNIIVNNKPNIKYVKEYEGKSFL